ncbi:MAG: ester cyclase [Coriobacteriia bacterium]|nr:ester cyclase [Coriobacteriia bacterium]
MTPDDMKSTIRRANDDCWHMRDLDAAYERFSEDLVFRRVPFPAVKGKTANRKGDEKTLAAYSETRSIIHEVVTEGDTAVAHWTWEGIHTGPSPSLGIPPTGKKVEMSGCSLYHFRDGEIFEVLEFGDLLGMLQQLGVIPAFS